MTVSSSTAALSKGCGEGLRESKRRKNSGLSLSHLKSPFKLIGSSKPSCRACGKKCSGEVVRVNEKLFHTSCFRCAACDANLSSGGFFSKESKHFCTNCYQSSFGTRCGKCGEYVEGEVVSALGQTFCQRCFTCASCNTPFDIGEKVTFNGKQCVCQTCVDNEERVENGVESSGSGHTNNYPKVDLKTLDGDNKKKRSLPYLKDSNVCSSCSQVLTEGHALVALDQQFHLWCFRCFSCNELLHGEYMGKEGRPYCEQCYQARFGVKCTYCRRYISGKVLQAGENNHFHPTCARCTKCGEPFGDGEEMFLQGAAIWHPTCGPGPNEAEDIPNGQGVTQPDQHSIMDERASIASHYASRASTPGMTSKSVADHRPLFSRSTAQIPPTSFPYGGSSRLYNSNSTYSLRRPVGPGDRVDSMSGGLQHFHLPPSRRPSLSATRQAWAQSSSRSLLSSKGPSRAASRQTNHDSFNAVNRALSCPPPKPGYTHQARAASTVPLSIFDHDRVSHASITINNYVGMNSADDGPKTTVFEEHKAYPIHLLLTTNYKLPLDVDRCNLEMHLTDSDFVTAFGMDRHQFYALPLWRRNDLKRRALLF